MLNASAPIALIRDRETSNVAFTLDDAGLGIVVRGLPPTPDYSPIWTQLKEAGFCQHLSDSKVELVKQEVMTRGWSGIFRRLPAMCMSMPRV